MARVEGDLQSSVTTHPMKGVVPGLREREGRLGLHLPGGLRVEPREKTSEVADWPAESSSLRKQSPGQIFNTP